MIVKPGHKTTELLASVVAGAGAWIAAWDGTLAPKYAAIASAIVAGLYSLSRGLTKLGAYYGAAKATPGVVAPASSPPPPPAAPTGGVEA